MIDSEWRSEIPEPVFDEKPEWVDLYYRAWELAHDHVREIPGMPQTPYMDEAFSPTDIWIWDTCFMTLFCKFAPKHFPGVETLRNFYAPLYDGFRFPEVTYESEGEQRTEQVIIHIPDNPPLFAWAEYTNALMIGDCGHLKDLLLRKKYLQKHFDWLENLTGQLQPCHAFRNLTFWQHRNHGYLWEGGRSGMDNTPRGRSNGRAGEINRPNNPEMLWVDAISQQALSALDIARSFELIGEQDQAAQWMAKYNTFKSDINRYYWCEEDGLYYDIHEKTGEFMKCVTPASFWPMLAGIPSEEQAARMIRYLTDDSKLGGEVPLVTLARDDADFDGEHGNYWRGSMWLPTAYMILKGLENYGYLDLARTLGRKIIRHMSDTYIGYEPHTIWECYAPGRPEPAFFHQENTRVRPDFCGWSALGPISIFLENVLGFHLIDGHHRQIRWSLPDRIAGALGIRNLHFGGICTSLVQQDGRLSTDSSAPYTLHVRNRILEIPEGRGEFNLN